jgi:trimeric autotransporter adhesin
VTRDRDLYSRVVTCILALSLLILLQSCGGGSSSPNQNSGSGQNSTVTVTGISPNSVQAGAGDTTIAVSGTNFLPFSVVTFNGQPLATTYKKATLLTAVIPASDLVSGNAIQIGVSNSSTSASTPLLFQINNPAPFLSSITPPSVTFGTSSTLTLTGIGFVPASTVLFNGTSRTPTYISNTSLQLSLSASDVVAPVSDTIAVVNAPPGGGTSPSVNFYVTQSIPSLGSVSPNSIQSGIGNVTLSLTGSDFSPNATVQANGMDLAITSQSATVITATLPATIVTQAGMVTVVVTNPGLNAESSAPVPIQIVDIPTLCCITPAAAPIGSPDFTITIPSSSFLIPGTFVRWNGQPLVTQNNGFQLTATIPAIDLASFTTGSLTLAVPVAYPAKTLVSAPQEFSTYLALPTNSILYNSHDNLLYASVPGSVLGSEGDSIVGIDPITGNIVRQIPVGSQPNKIAISDDGTQLFVGLDGAGAVRQVNLSTAQAGQQFSLGGGRASTIRHLLPRHLPFCQDNRTRLQSSPVLAL